MNQTQAQNLLNVANALHDAADAEWYFDMAVWGRELGNFLLDQLPKDEVEFVKENKCGTPACALGHYAVRSDLQSKFRLDTNGGLKMFTPSAPKRGSYVSLSDRQLRDHFGISIDEAGRLFDGDGCGNATTPRAAADYIERFIKRKGYDIVDG